jgi:hypothetical protein
MARRYTEGTPRQSRVVERRISAAGRRSAIPQNSFAI